MGNDESEINCTINKLNESFLIEKLGLPKEFWNKIIRDEWNQRLILNQEKVGVENIHSVAVSIAERVMQYLSGTKHCKLIYEAELERLVAHSDVRMLNSKTLLQRVVCN